MNQYCKFSSISLRFFCCFCLSSCSHTGSLHNVQLLFLFGVPIFLLNVCTVSAGFLSEHLFSYSFLFWVFSVHLLFSYSFFSGIFLSIFLVYFVFCCFSEHLFSYRFVWIFLLPEQLFSYSFFSVVFRSI